MSAFSLRVNKEYVSEDVILPSNAIVFLLFNGTYGMVALL